MKGKQLTVQEVSKLDNGVKVYVNDGRRVSLELVAKTKGSSLVRTVSIYAGRDNYRELTNRYVYHEYIKGVDLPEMPEITFDTIRYAIAHCKHLNDSSKRIHNIQLFPGIDEAYEFLNNMANHEPKGMDTGHVVVCDRHGRVTNIESLYEQGFEMAEDISEEECGH